MTRTKSRRQPETGPSHRHAVLIRTLQMSGFDPRDFDVVESRAPQLGAVKLSDDMLAVRRRSTGEERLYVADPELSWFALVVDDLHQGRFGAGLRGA
jgi:hypothetical protein